MSPSTFSVVSQIVARSDLAGQASMLDITLAHALLQAVPSSAVLVLVGDVDQLPSVGPGKVLQVRSRICLRGEHLTWLINGRISLTRNG